VGIAPPAQVQDTIFGKISRGEIPCEFIYEDDLCCCFPDRNPQAPVHLLLIPKKPISQLSKADTTDAALLGHLMLVVGKIAKKQNLADGYRVVINDGKNGGQTVYHLHLHILAGRSLTWPPG